MKEEFYFSIKDIKNFLQSKGISWDGKFRNYNRSFFPIVNAKIDDFKNCGYGLHVQLTFNEGKKPNMNSPLLLRVNNRRLTIVQENRMDYGYGYHSTFYTPIYTFKEEWAQYLLENGKRGYVEFITADINARIKENDDNFKAKMRELKLNAATTNDEIADCEETYKMYKEEYDKYLDVIADYQKSK